LVPATELNGNSIGPCRLSEIPEYRGAGVAWFIDCSKYEYTLRQHDSKFCKLCISRRSAPLGLPTYF
jgi:hypothetical protein